MPPPNKQQFSLGGLLLVTVMAMNGYLVAPGAKAPLALLLWIRVALPPLLWIGREQPAGVSLGALFPALSTAVCALIMMVAATFEDERIEPAADLDL